jgi:hypothetical protein
MGSSYFNVTVLGATAEQVEAALGDQPALVGTERDGTVAVFPADEMDLTVAQRLSAALSTPVVGAMVFDDDILHVLTWVGGAPGDEICVPDPAQVFGPEMADMAAQAAAEMAEMAEFGDLADMGIDPAAMGAVPGTGPGPGHDAQRLVDLLGRGDAAAVGRALAKDQTFASERHHDVAAALGLPTAVAGWGYGYLTRHGEDYTGGPLTEVPRP